MPDFFHDIFVTDLLVRASVAPGAAGFFVTG